MKTTNTHIVAADFEYYRAASVHDALAALGDGSRARFLAGGTDLLVQIKMERHTPDLLVDLTRVKELKEIRSVGDGLELGSMATIRAIADDATVRSRCAALAESCRRFSTMQIMIMGTVGGNISNASPAADTVPPLLVFDARVDLISATGEREVQLSDLFLGPGLTLLREDELLRTVKVRLPDGPTGSAFAKATRVAADIAKVNVAVRLTRDGDRVRECRIALGSVAPRPIRAQEAEAQCVQLGELTSETLPAVAATAAAEAAPITDVRSSDDYRKHVTRVLVRDSLAVAWLRAGGRNEQ